MNNPLVKFFAVKIQRKLMLVVILLIVVVMAGVGLYWINNAVEKETAALNARADMMVTLLSQTLAVPMWDLDLGLVQSNVGAVMEDLEVAAVEVYDTNGVNPVASAIRAGETADPIVKEEKIVYTDKQGAHELGKVKISYTKYLVNYKSNQNMLFIGVIVLILVGSLSVGLYLLVGSMIIKPLGEMTRSIGELSKGDCRIELKSRSKDEVGQMADALRSLMAYLQEMSGTATQISSGDLAVAVKPLSERDVLGQAFSQMVSSLRQALADVTRNARDLNQASDQLATVAGQAGRATSQIAATIQQVAKGITTETESVSKTASSVEEMSRSIDGVAKGAQEQANSVNQVVQQMNALSDAV
ncbi:MAG TPA: methyl-accepting chemotaxis protein, partial [Anaerolineaceae bacterium]|nr:methyl-accepting chemotaxis protein [Anaerolineaceae bacterium]